MSVITQINKQIYIQAEHQDSEEAQSFDPTTLQKTMNEEFNFPLKRKIANAVLATGMFVLTDGMLVLTMGIIGFVVGFGGLWLTVAGGGAIILALAAIHFLDKSIRTPLFDAYTQLFYRDCEKVYYVSQEAWKYFKEYHTKQKALRDKKVDEALQFIPAAITALISELDTSE